MRAPTRNEYLSSGRQRRLVRAAALPERDRVRMKQATQALTRCTVLHNLERLEEDADVAGHRATTTRCLHNAANIVVVVVVAVVVVAAVGVEVHDRRDALLRRICARNLLGLRERELRQCWIARHDKQLLQHERFLRQRHNASR